MPTLQQLFHTACEVLALWGAPVVCAFLLLPGARGWPAAVYLIAHALCCYVLATSGAQHGAQLTLLLVALLYFAGLGWLLRRHARALLACTTPPALFVLCLVAFLLLPALSWPHAQGAAFLPLAWETALCAYSLCVESGRQPNLPSVRESLFFLLVDPSLVFLDAERARPRTTPVAPGRALLRVVLGVLLAGPASLLFRERGRIAELAIAESPALPALLVRGAVLFLAFYVSHSALASFRIGMTRLLGYEIRERYHYPFLARSPLDFWQRWNTYVGAWFKYYVFFPVASRVRLIPHARPVAPLVALLTTMLSVGFLHDVYVYAATSGAGGTFTSYFAAAAALMVAWELCARAVASTTLPWGMRRWRALAVGFAPLEVLCASQLICLCFGWLSP
jgi:hypothetical protein